jgi:SAM-dependent methyltransferase
VTRDAEWFDAHVSDSGAFDPFSERGWQTLATVFRKMVPQSDGAHLLDVGCGTGSSRTIYARAQRYIGIDHSFAAVRLARSTRSTFTRDLWLGGDALQLPFADRSFDLVAFSSVLHHIPDRTRALKEALRVLRPGGSVFAFDPNLLHPALALFRHPSSPLYNPKGVSPEERPLLPSQLATSFRAAGFTDLRQRAQADIPYRQVAVGALNRLLPLYNAADWLMDRIGLGRWFGSFVITAARRPTDG